MRHGDKRDGVQPSLVSVEWPGDARLLGAWTGRSLQSREPWTLRHVLSPKPSEPSPAPMAPPRPSTRRVDTGLRAAWLVA